MFTPKWKKEALHLVKGARKFVHYKRDLLEAIAFPSATYAREYEPWIVTLRDGTQQLGRLGRETDDALELIDAQGQSSRFPADQIKNRQMAPVSAPTRARTPRSAPQPIPVPAQHRSIRTGSSRGPS